MLDEFLANFRELRQREVRRTPFRRSSVNRRRAAGGDVPDLSEPSESREDGR
jgi:hypothetical protein